jgi:hypothetical protein
MRIVLIFAIVMVVAGCLYAGASLTRCLVRRWLWLALA